MHARLRDIHGSLFKIYKKDGRAFRISNFIQAKPNALIRILKVSVSILLFFLNLRFEHSWSMTIGSDTL